MLHDPAVWTQQTLTPTHLAGSTDATPPQHSGLLTSAMPVSQQVGSAARFNSCEQFTCTDDALLFTACGLLFPLCATGTGLMMESDLRRACLLVCLFICLFYSGDAKGYISLFVSKNVTIPLLHRCSTYGRISVKPMALSDISVLQAASQRLCLQSGV